MTQINMFSYFYELMVKTDIDQTSELYIYNRLTYPLRCNVGDIIRLFGGIA